MWWKHATGTQSSSAFRQTLTQSRSAGDFIVAVLGFQSGVTVAGYASAKSAIVGLINAMANEWAAKKASTSLRSRLCLP
jgi:NAD(P)-dependent dehydrogenase (short-subunit alcohol dehydrogenase family)